MNFRHIEEYKYLSPEVRRECYNFHSKRIKTIVTYYDSQIIELIDKYGIDIFQIAYGFGQYKNEGELNLASDNNDEIDLERKLLEDYNKIMNGTKYVARDKLNFDAYAKIVTNAPEEYVGKNNKVLFESYSTELLKKLYSVDHRGFYLDRYNANIIEIFKSMNYQDFMSYISGNWFYSDVNEVLKSVLSTDDYQKVQEFRKRSQALNRSNAFIVLYDPENMDKVLENIEKLGSVNALKLAISSGEKNVYEFAEKLYAKYGRYLEFVDTNQIIGNDKDIDIETLYDRMEQSIAEKIKNRKILEYGEDLPQSFKDKNPELFLGDEIPAEIKEKFYKRQLQYSDFYKDGKFDNELWEYLKFQHLYIGTKEDITFLAKSYDNETDVELLNKKVLEVLKRIEDLEKNQMTSETKKIFMEWISKNIVNPEMDYDTFCKKARNIYVLIDHIILSNSSELRRFQDRILEELLNVENPMQTLKETEKIFLNKEKSIDERLFSCFLYLHPNFNEFCKRATSPVIQKYIKKGDTEFVKNILKKDLLKAILGSNNRSIREVFEKDEASESLKITLQSLGINSAKEALEYMDNRIANADCKNRSKAEKGKLQIEKGDFIKGLNSGGILYIEQILQNGSLCKEFLGAAAQTDATPLDTDVSIIGEKGIKETYSYGGWGPIYVLLKNDDRFVNYEKYKSKPQEISEEEIQKNSEKMEFCSNGNNIGGIRTGFSSTDIDAFIVQEGTYDRRLEIEIVKNGFYIPITDIDGKVLFTPKQYDKLRSKMSGLEHYGTEGEYEIDSTLISDEIIQLESQLDKVHSDNENMKRKIYDAFKKAIEKYNSTLSNPEDVISLKKFMDDKIVENEIEVLSTGSSARDTNVPGGKLDFDFIIRLDNKLLKSSKGKAIKEKIIRNMCEEFHIDYKSGDIKDVEIEVDGEKVKADFSFIGKTDKIEYSTEMCLKDRLDQIQKKDPDKYRYTIANIMLAKKVLAENDVYKKRDGALGGVGVENWILQNGGSFHKAVTNFLEVAEKCGGNYEEFKKQYAIWDFGKNHYSCKDDKNYFPHDDFIYANLTSSKFNKMISVLQEYMKSHSFSEFDDHFRKKTISFSDIQTFAREIPVSEEIGSARPFDEIEEIGNVPEYNVREK